MRMVAPDIESKAIAMIARGDSLAQIARDLTISPATVSSIKERNSATINEIRVKMVEREKEINLQLLAKSQRLINKKLEWAEEDEQNRRSAIIDAREGNISEEEFAQKTFRTESISIRDLSAIAKDALEATKEERKKNSNNTVARNAQELRELVKMLESGDEIEMQRIVFRSADEVEEEIAPEDNSTNAYNIDQPTET